MQEVDLTSQLLLDFSAEYAKVPNVSIVDADDSSKLVPFEIKILACWFSNMIDDGKSPLFIAFQAWLCGRGSFIMPVLSNEEFIRLLADTIKPKLRS